MSDERMVTFHPMQPGWWFHHYDADSHEIASYAVVGFESVPVPYVPDPETTPNPNPRLVEARLEFLGAECLVALVLSGRPGEVTFRFRTEEPIGVTEGCTASWLGLYPGTSREALLDHFHDDIEAMRDNLRRASAGA